MFDYLAYHQWVSKFFIHLMTFIFNEYMYYSLSLGIYIYVYNDIFWGILNAVCALENFEILRNFGASFSFMFVHEMMSRML